MDVDPFADIVGQNHVRRATEYVAGVAAHWVVEPGSAEEVGQALRLADAAGLAVIPRGGGTKLGWGNPPRCADVVLSLARLDRIVEHAWGDLTVTVEVGCPVAQLQDALAQHGQRLAVDVLWPERATVGGILATNESGALRLRYGGLRDLVIGITLALADGTLAASGGKVVKNVAGYDLPKLATGALGTLGVITQATFRLHALPRSARTLLLSPSGLNEVQRLLLVLQDAQLAHSALQIVLGFDGSPAMHLLLEGTAAGVAGQVDEVRRLAAPMAVVEGSPEVWMARQELWPTMDNAPGVIAKVSLLPSRLAAFVTTVEQAARAMGARWGAVVQATGLGFLRLNASAADLPVALHQIRLALEADGGSLAILRQPPGAALLEAWGDPGDALGLMRSLKQQFDPRGTLNPGRYVGGI